MRVLYVENHLSSEKLIKEIKQEKKKRAADRLRMILLVKEGKTAKETAEILNCHPETVRNNVHKFNKKGIEGLSENHLGCPRRLNKDQEEILCSLVNGGPKPDNDVSVFRGTDIQKIIIERFGVNYHLNSVYLVLHRLNLSWQRPRPYHPKSDKEKQEAFKAEIPAIIEEIGKVHPKKKSNRGFKTSRDLACKEF